MFLTTNPVIAYLTTFLVEAEKAPLDTASLIVLLGLLCTAVTYPPAGALSDVLRRKWAFFWACAFGTIGFSWLLVLVVGGSSEVGEKFWRYPTFPEFFPTRVRSTGANLSHYAGRGLSVGLFPLVALPIGGSVPMALALGVVGPVTGALFSLARRTVRAVGSKPSSREP
jgi:MFS family permease